MKLKTFLIIVTIVNLLLEGYFGFDIINVYKEFSRNGLPSEIFGFLIYRSVFNIAFTIIGLLGIIFYFVNKNTFGKILRIYLLHQVIEFFFFLPTKLKFYYRVIEGDMHLQLWREFIYFFNILFIVLIIVYFLNRKIKVIPRRVTRRSIRFSHYIIDNLYLNLLVFKISGLQLLMSLNEYSMSSSPSSIFMLYLLLMISPFFYYTISEGIFKQSIGKVVTGTYVRSKNGQPPGFAKILLRSLCRFIPFEAFSFFPKPMAKWHDSFSGTDVFYPSKIQINSDSIIDHLITKEK